MQNKIQSIFCCMNEEKIRYCQWKSSLNLTNSFAGKTDFDILVDRKDINKLLSLLINKGFKRRQSTYDKTYHSMEDYIGFDSATGRLIHFHLHYTLIMGKKLTKNIRIPIEKFVLDNTMIDNNFGIKIIQPEIELFLLSFRIMLKTKIGKSLILTMLKHKRYLPQNIINEYNYLFAKIDFDEFEKIGNLYFMEFYKDVKLLVNNLNIKLNIFKFFKIKKRIERKLLKYKRFDSLEKKCEYQIRKFSSKNSRNFLSSGGLSIAFIGADGSGKSTITEEITHWLNWKLSVRRIYMGIPKKDKMCIILGYLGNIARKLQLLKFEKYIFNFRWLYVSYYRKKNFYQSQKFKNQGYIIVFDRYPLDFFSKMEKPMDGERIDSTSILSCKEKKNYQQIKLPDEMICLRVTLQQSINRKKEHQLSLIQGTIKNKIEAIDSLVNANISKKIKVINSDCDLNSKILKIKKIIWDML
ncbi:MAG: hypothetical protein HN334_01415 [Candidatus Cloacimonetes bacterium]|jgi:thymidylate kinase|nr:hypothetical protein [Candidatus Cloacimonadota bacterium]